jgi:hypothetical protein
MKIVHLESLKYLLVLIEAARAEEADFLNMPTDPRMETQEFGYNVTEVSSWKAYSGSMDAMKALAKAIIPGRGWKKEDRHDPSGSFIESVFWSTDPGNPKSGQICEYRNHNDARAWLVATLKVIIFDEETKRRKAAA